MKDLLKRCWSSRKWETRDHPRLFSDLQHVLLSPCTLSLSISKTKYFSSNFPHLLSSCSFLLASSTSFWCWRWCRSSSSVLLAGKPGGLGINIVKINFNLNIVKINFNLNQHQLDKFPPAFLPGLHDETRTRHCLRFCPHKQQILPLFPHDLRHLLRRPGKNQRWV